MVDAGADPAQIKKPAPARGGGIMSPEEAAVLAANAAFYDAFARRDAAAMDALWAREVEVACIHPGWEALRGRAQVLASWRAILSGSPPPIRCAEATAHLLGGAAFVICAELMPGAR